MAQPIIVPITNPPLVVPFGGRTVVVPNWPIPLKPSENRVDELVDEELALVIGPRSRRRWETWLIAALVISPSFLLLGFTLVSLVQETNGLGKVLIGGLAIVVIGFVCLVVLSLLSNGTWIRLDPIQRAVTRSRSPFLFWKKPRVFQTIPFDQVVCIQLIYNGYHEDEYQVGGQEQTSHISSRYHAYQMNLLLDRNPPERINLANHSDWQWIRDAGQRIATTLDIPVVDQLYHGG